MSNERNEEILKNDAEVEVTVQMIEEKIKADEQFKKAIYELVQSFKKDVGSEKDYEEDITEEELLEDIRHIWNETSND